MNEWKQIDCMSHKFIWSEYACKFLCPCGEDVLLSDELVICECGRIYRLVIRVEVKENAEHSH